MYINSKLAVWNTLFTAVVLKFNSTVKH